MKKVMMIIGLIMLMSFGALSSDDISPREACCIMNEGFSERGWATATRINNCDKEHLDFMTSVGVSHIPGDRKNLDFELLLFYKSDFTANITSATKWRSDKAYLFVRGFYFRTTTAKLRRCRYNNKNLYERNKCYVRSWERIDEFDASCFWEAKIKCDSIK